MDFSKDVIEASAHLPIVVDFWAPWCGPCKVLGPIIEELAKENQDRWQLVKVNTEEAPDIAAQYAIRSIPNVKLFSDGQVVAEFAGALPRYQIEAWLDEHLPSEADKAWIAVHGSLQNMDGAAQRDALESFLNKYPSHEEARHLLAKAWAFIDTSQGLELLRDIKMAHPHYSTLQDLQAIAELSAVDESESEGALKPLREAARQLSAENIDGAAQSIIEAVSIDKEVLNELPRRAGVALFRLLGDQDPVSKKHRRTFDMWLS